MGRPELDCWVRDADSGDVGVLGVHDQESLSEGRNYRGGTLDLRLRPSAGMALVAGFGETVMGSLTAELDDAHGWVIGRIYVVSAAREVGLGDALLRTFLDRVRASGETRVLAQAQPGDRSTKNLFERHGLVARTILVGRDLSDRSSGADASL